MTIAIVYRQECIKCRVISRILWAFGLGYLQRRGMNRKVADRLAQRNRIRAKIFVLHARKLYFGWHAVFSLVVTLAMPWTVLLSLAVFLGSV